MNVKALLAAVAVLALAAGARATAPDVTGVWSVAVDEAHGAAAMSLVLKQDGTKVSGTFVSGHGPDLALTGELTDDTLRLESSDADEHHRVLFKANLKPDGTLAGYVSGPMGDMKMTATRVKDRR